MRKASTSKVATSLAMLSPVTKEHLLDQSLPPSEIEWLCVDVDGYKIVKSLQTSTNATAIPKVFPHLCLYAGHFNYRHVDWDCDDNIPDGKCLPGQVLQCQRCDQLLLWPVKHWNQSRSSFR